MNNKNNSLQKHGLSAKTSSNITNTFIYIALILMTVIWLFPFVGIVLESLRVESEAQVSYFWPKQFGFDNYVKLFTKTDFPKWFLNTGLMGVATSVFQTFFILSMSYTLSRLRFKGRKALMNFMLILGMFINLIMGNTVSVTFRERGIALIYIQ